MLLDKHGAPIPDYRESPAFVAAALNGHFLQSLRHEVNGVLLDLGAGNRPYEVWYSQLCATHVSCDFESLPGLSTQAVGEALPFADSSFGTVIATEVLEHTLNIEAVMEEIHRVLQPGGSVFITVPFMYPVHEAPFDHWRFTHHGLVVLLERHGFDVLDIQSKGGLSCMAVHYLANALSLAFPQHPKLVGRVMMWPQRLTLRFLGKRTVTGIRGVVSMGYMAAGRKRG
jgi:SAM-dependent methyltransferase